MTNPIVYNQIGNGYNRTRRADPYIAQRLHALLSPIDGGHYLDIGCGTGNYTAMLADMGLDITGVDPSEAMLEEARTKLPVLQWLYGTAENIPLPNDSMDGAVATLTLHHWKNLDEGFKEMARVLKPGAVWVIFTFTPEQERSYWLNHFFPNMMRRSTQKAIPFDKVLQAAATADLTLAHTEKYYVHNELQDLFMYSGKHNPELYFDPVVRDGISSFAMLSDPEEVENGLNLLRSSLDNSTFQSIKEQYANDLGDYLFAIFKNNTH
jgi:ubiquinone/menaquinone biosynthesis C-methylase UbiE